MRRHLLFMSCCLVLLFAALGSAWAAPTCEAGPDLSVTTDELGGYVIHGTVSSASSHTWAVWDDAIQWWTMLTDCDVPVGPDGEADLTLSAGQLTPGVHLLQLLAKALPNQQEDGSWQYCGASATDTMTLVVDLPTPTCEAGPDLSVTTDELGGYVIHGTVSNASYYYWVVWDDATQWWTFLTDCDVPVGPDGEADLTLSAGQLTPGVHLLGLGAKALPNQQEDGSWQYCGASAGDTMTLAVCPAAPVIQNVWIIPYHTVSPDKEFWSECAQITALDADGWQDIAGTDSIMTVNPNSDPRPSLDGCSWTSDDGLYTLYQGWSLWEESTFISPGAYTVTAEDLEGHTSAPVAASFVEWPPMQSITYPTDGSVIAETVPLFAWEAVPDAYQFDIWLLEQGQHGYSTVWRQFGIPAGSTSIVYNDDGTATASELTPGKHYELRISAFHPDQDPSDQASVAPVTERAIRFWLEPKFVGFLEPINNDGSSIFKLKSTVPVKFRLLNADGTYKSDAVATLSVAKVEPDIVGTYQEAVSTNAPDSGSTFRYVGDHYQFNLGTKNLSVGTWSLRVKVNDVVMKEGLISLK